MTAPIQTRKVKVLVLDDDKRRLDYFQKKLGHQDLMLVTTYHDAINALRYKGPFDIVFLDHDIADFDGRNREFTQSGLHEWTGMHVAQFIANMPAPMRPSRVIVHSQNVVGGPLMVQLLLAAGVNVTRAPFSP